MSNCGSTRSREGIFFFGDGKMSIDSSVISYQSGAIRIGSIARWFWVTDPASPRSQINPGLENGRCSRYLNGLPRMCCSHHITHATNISKSHIRAEDEIWCEFRLWTIILCFLSVALLICAAVYLVITLVLLWMTLYIRFDCLIFLQCLVIVTNETLCSATATSEH